MTLAEAVHATRRARRLSLVEAAALTGVSDRHLSFIERGLRTETHASLDMIRRLSVLGFSVLVTNGKVTIDVDPVFVAGVSRG